ncbi:hypothetical protein [Dyadobacter psychrotolerans]|uniref:Uncharacterized protein n=1 Tax=Dyadobacter psychrotolerans TaxID=2541721 RepID=A0A4R5DXD0_9BACT|nr:hypothetical protein [Dyadobacter psychrotolerans]TDE17314.1 hypothetical protein E0F88_05335 [Dyadobacter psychrotolerans]
MKTSIITLEEIIVIFLYRARVTAWSIRVTAKITASGFKPSGFVLLLFFLNSNYLAILDRNFLRQFTFTEYFVSAF